MTLSPPVFQVFYDMDSKKYVAQSIYVNGKTLETIAKADTFAQVMDDIRAHDIFKAFGVKAPIDPGAEMDSSSHPEYGTW